MSGRQLLQKLVTQTAVYGLSTILVRMLNFLLAPFHTRVFTDQSDYGIISDMYAYVTFLNVIFMYGMETAFFRFSSNHKLQTERVYGTAQSSLLISTLLLCIPLLLFSQQISEWLQYPGHGEYVVYFALIIAFDTLVNIPFARLRLQQRPWTYFIIKLCGVTLNVLLNVLFLWPVLQDEATWLEQLGFTFEQNRAVSYVFLANLIASAAVLLYFLPSMKHLKPDWKLWRQLWKYGWPLVIIGLAGMVNETFDRILLKYLLPGSLNENLAQVGIYSAVYKISIFMTLAVQAFKMGAEPFFFQQSTNSHAPALYARVMTYFVMACCVIFVAVGLFPDVYKIIIGVNYHEGLGIVPILLMANLLSGVYYNQSIWYKLTDKTLFATLIPVSGAILSTSVNIWLIPTYGYVGAAWSHVVCYGSMVVLSYWLGQRHYPVPYNLRKLGVYVLFSVVLLQIGLFIEAQWEGHFLSVILRLLLVLLFVLFAFWLDVKPLLRQR